MTYKPAAFDHKLAVSMNVFNALNERVVTSTDTSAEYPPYVISNTYTMPISYTTPRYVQFSVSYDY